jgi:2,3-bisphosphoglycerate-independent phosphoglycerate mutase
MREARYAFDRIMKVTPVLLLILDGFGHREECDANAICQARKPHWNFLWATHPHTLIDASEKWVGLPKLQMGNSEVGHMNIGAGRVVYQDYTRIEHAIETGEFTRNPVLTRAIETARAGRALHVLGLVSPGGVHSHESQIHAFLEIAARGGAKDVRVHAFLDGRDTPPKSAEASLAALGKLCARLGTARIASICGRYYAMDRDKRWERLEPAYRLITDGSAAYQAADAVEGLRAAYARGETDEFVKPTAIVPPGGTPARMSEGDAVVFMNFRADRARQITAALTAPQFDGFPRAGAPRPGYFCSLTSYGEDLSHVPAAFPPQSVKNGFGEYISRLGLKQLRIAETEKYAHVTYFFNGGSEAPYPGEERIMVPSPKVATYDLKPEMSAFEVTERLLAAIRGRSYDAIICNYANSDMVGHTGDLAAATRAIEVLDECIGKVVAAMREAGGEVLITADHGNAETMVDPDTHQPHTAHTLNLVPALYIGRKAAAADGGALQDVAPTLLDMMGLERPAEMTGKPLFVLP